MFDRMRRKMKRRCHISACRYMKCAVFGDTGCGKTALLARFQNHEFPVERYASTEVNRQYSRDLQFDRQDISLDIWDTGTSSIMQHQAYNVQAVLICYAVDSPTSLASVLTTWHRDAEHFADGVPVMLVGLKTDLRTRSPEAQLVSRSDAEDVARRIGSFGFMETSAKSGVGVAELFDLVAKHSLQKRTSATCCTLL